MSISWDTIASTLMFHKFWRSFGSINRIDNALEGIKRFIEGAYGREERTQINKISLLVPPLA